MALCIMAGAKSISISGKVYKSISKASTALNLSYSIIRTRLSSIDFPDWVCESIEKNGSVLSNKYENWVKRDNRWEKL